MRKILNLTRNGIAALSAVGRHSNLVAFGAGLAVTFCCFSTVTAQQPRVATSPAVAYSAAHAANQAEGGAGGTKATTPWQQGTPTVDAAYSVLNDRTSNQQASFGLRQPPAAAVNNPCIPGCDINFYLSYEGLWLKRENDERFSLSRNTFMPEFDYEFGGRYTAGQMFDCVNAWEVVYAGPFDWQRSSTVTGAANLQSQFSPSGGYTAAELSAFNNADSHSQAYRAQLQSFEFNRRWWSWDVVSTMIGIRYVDYEEDYAFFSNRAGTGTGLYGESVDNQLIGAQLGADVLYPVSLRANVGFRGKGGVYANFDERRTFLNNAGTLILNAGDDDVDVAGVIEWAIFSNYQVTRSIRLTSSYEFWYLPGMATVPEQRPSLISPSSGTTVEDSDDLFLHGGSLGLQILF